MSSKPHTGLKALVEHEQLEEQDRELQGMGKKTLKKKITALKLPSHRKLDAPHSAPPWRAPSHSPILSHMIVIDPGHLLRWATHEEERHTEEGGEGQHHHREAWDGLEGEPHPLHDDSAHQHPHCHGRQVNGACGERGKHKGTVSH